MKNHHLTTCERPSTNFLGIKNLLLSERNRGAYNRNSVFANRRENRREEQPKSAFPSGKWVNRGENDGLDFFL